MVGCCLWPRSAIRPRARSRAGSWKGAPDAWRNSSPMDPDRLLTLTDAAMLAGCSRKALERRVERGSLHVIHGEDGQRAVRLADLMRSGLVALMPACAPVGSAPARVEEAESEREALRTALTATEAALRRSREDMRIVRTRLMEAEARPYSPPHGAAGCACARPRAVSPAGAPTARGPWPPGPPRQGSGRSRGCVRAHQPPRPSMCPARRRCGASHRARPTAP